MRAACKGVRFYLAPFFMAATFSWLVQAAVPVVDLSVLDTIDVDHQVQVKAAKVNQGLISSSPASSQASLNKQDSLSILFNQMQILRDEMLALRGQVEQQQNDLKKLKQQQKENYLDVDKRLSVVQKQQTVPVKNAVVGPVNLSAVDKSSAVNKIAEKNSYDKAYALMSSNKNDEAVLAFRKHLINYPDGEFAGNAYYWLGLIYRSQAKLPEAEEKYLTLLKRFPKHRKVADAKFALGNIYFKQGKKAKAKVLITEASKEKGTTAKLATQFLHDNF